MVKTVRGMASALMLGIAVTCSEPPQPTSRVSDGEVPEFRGVSSRTIRVDTLEMEYTIGDSTTWSMPTTIGLFGNHLILSDQFADPHISIVELDSREIVGRFGKHGEGPAEFMQPAWFLPHDSIESQVWIHDLTRQDLTLIDLRLPLETPIVERRFFNPARQVAFPVITGDTVIATSLASDVSLFKMNLRAEIIDSTVIALPYNERELPDVNGRYMANARRSAYHPETHDIVLTYFHASRLDFFDPHGQHRGTVAGPRPNNVSFGYRGAQFGFESDHQGAYMYVTATRNYVYALYCGCKANYTYRFVHVFDWGGNFIRELVLNPGVAAFAVDQEDEHLYGVIHEPLPTVGVWALPTDPDET